jgi:hypothetical protein
MQGHRVRVVLHLLGERVGKARHAPRVLPQFDWSTTGNVEGASDHHVCVAHDRRSQLSAARSLFSPLQAERTEACRAVRVSRRTTRCHRLSTTIDDRGEFPGDSLPSAAGTRGRSNLRDCRKRTPSQPSSVGISVGMWKDFDLESRAKSALGVSFGHGRRAMHIPRRNQMFPHRAPIAA